MYKDTLDAAGIPIGRLKLYDFVPKLMKSVYIVVGHSRHGRYMSPAVLNALYKCQDKALMKYKRPKSKDRLYVRRGNQYLRKIVNDDQVGSLLSSYGFQILETGSMTFSEQVEAFSNCEIAVGVAGAGLTNVCWQSRGTACIGLYPSSMPDTFFWWICQHRGIRFADVRCPITKGDNWNGDIEVSVSLLEEVVKKAIAGKI